MMANESLRALFLAKADIEAVAPSYGEIVDLVEQTYRWDAEGEVETPAKIGVHPEWPNAFLHAMPARVGGMGALGAKIVTYYPGNYDRKLPDSTAVILLYDDETGQPLAIMEGMWITFARTVASAIVAAKHLSRKPVRSVGLVGCGGLGRWSLLMLSEVFPDIEEVRVASRTKASRMAFCELMDGLGPWTLRPVDEVADAVRNNDIVISSTPQEKQPRLKAAWWTPGTLAIPFDLPYSWDDSAVGQVDLLVSDGMESIARIEKGLSSVGRPGLKFPERREALADLVSGRVSGRQNDKQRILVFVAGVASTDITVALDIYRRARDAGIGTFLKLD